MDRDKETSMTKKILVVDDEEDMLWMLQKKLNKGMENIEILSAKSGEEALEILAKKPVVLVITDINMPGINGLDLLIEISNRYPSIGVMIMTAYPSSGYKDKAVMNGSLRFIEKPFDINVLRGYVAEFLGKDSSFQGTIDGIELLDIIQFNSLSKANAALRVTANGSEGIIFFDHGSINHAMFEQFTGEEAFYKILALQGGTIKNMRNVEPPMVSINKSTEALILEGAVIVDNAKSDNTLEDENRETTGNSSIHSNQSSDEGEEEMNKIEGILTEFTNIEGVHTACLVGRDGFILDAISRQGVDAEMIGAIASSGFGSADSMGEQLGQGSLTMTMIEYQNGLVMFAPVGEEAFLVIVADKETNLGWIRLSIKKNSKTIEQNVSI